MKRLRGWCGVVLLAGLLAGCGGGGEPAAPQAPAEAVARVEIEQTGLLLTGVGASAQLAAVATDAQGRVVDAALTWRSSNPAAVTVDAGGRVTAAAASGSAQLTAEAQGVQSGVLLVAVAAPPAGALRLDDTQIVGDPVETDPGAAPSFANTYRVVLTGVAAPRIGQLLVNTGSKPVGGEVVAVDSSGGTHRVTLKLVSARVLLPGLDLDETFDLSRAVVEFPADLAARYDISRNGNTYRFTPRPGAFDAVAPRRRASAAGTPVGTHVLPPFTSCESSLTTLPVALSMPPLFSVTISPSLDVRYSPANGLERFVVQAEPVIAIEGGLNVTAAFEGKIECRLELFVFRIPVGGALSLIVGGLVPVGAGPEAGGKVTVATMGIASKAQAKAKAQIGLACPGGADCSFVRELTDRKLEYEPKVDLPSIGDLRVEPTLMAFGFVDLQIGNPFLRRIRFEAFKLRAGGKLAASFAPMIGQITDTDYKSDYKVSLEATAGLGAELDSVLQLLGLSSISALELTISTDLARSPVGTVTADRATFSAGDTVNFSVHFEPATKDFFPGIGPFNISRVLLVRRNGLQTTLVASATAAPDQTDFNIPFTAADFGTVGEFTAFVVTGLLPAEPLGLEIGAATGTNPGGPTTLQNLIVTVGSPAGSTTAIVTQADGSETRLAGDTATVTARINAMLAGVSMIERNLVVRFLERGNVSLAAGGTAVGYDLFVTSDPASACGSVASVAVGDVGRMLSTGGCIDSTVATGNIGRSIEIGGTNSRIRVTAGEVEQRIAIGNSIGTVISSSVEVDFTRTNSLYVWNNTDTTVAVRGRVERRASQPAASIGIGSNSALRLSAPITGGTLNYVGITGSSFASAPVITVGDIVHPGGSVSSPSGNIAITGNQGLALGLLGMGSVAGELRIQDNRGFSNDAALSFAGARTVGGATVISGNSP